MSVERFGTWCTILAMGAALVAQWSSQAERVENLRTKILDVGGDVAALEQRMRAQESSDALEDKIALLTVQVTELRVEVKALREQQKKRY